MCFCHIANKVPNTWIGCTNDEADCSMLASSNALGERENQFLQSRRGERASP